MMQGLVYAQGFYPERFITEAARSSTSSTDTSILKFAKFYWGLFFDWMQVVCEKINVYDQIDLSEVASDSLTNRVNKLYLGVMPRTSYNGEFQRLFNEGTFSVVSFLEDFENEEADFNLGQVIRVPSPDFKPVSIDNIDIAVDAISSSLDKENVYVHCKSGKGRSAVAVLGYVMKQLYNQNNVKYFDPEFCFQEAEKIVTRSRNANTVRSSQNSKAQVLLDWYREKVLYLQKI